MEELFKRRVVFLRWLGRADERLLHRMHSQTQSGGTLFTKEKKAAIQQFQIVTVTKGVPLNLSLNVISSCRIVIHLGSGNKA
jgi:hypothetical protein